MFWYKCLIPGHCPEAITFPVIIVPSMLVSVTAFLSMCLILPDSVGSLSISEMGELALCVWVNSITSLVLVGLLFLDKVVHLRHASVPYA